MLHWTYYLLLLAVLLTGLALNLFSLPGNWVMLAAMAIYGFATHWLHFGWPAMLTLLVLAGVAELIEFLAAGAGAKKAGGSLWGTVGALTGGLVGAILFTGLIPIPVVGTIAGILIGTFGGAMLGELLGGKEVGHSALIGFGAAKGRLYGTMTKLAFACAMLLIALWVAIPWPGHARAAAAPLAPPRAAPATTPNLPSTGPSTLPSAGPSTSGATLPSRAIAFEEPRA